MQSISVRPLMIAVPLFLAATLGAVRDSAMKRSNSNTTLPKVGR